MCNYDLLIEKFINRTISLEEKQVLQEWILESDVNLTILKNRLRDSGLEISQHFDADLAYQKFASTLKLEEKRKIIFFKEILKYAAAIVVFLSIGFFVKDKFFDPASKSSTIIVKMDKEPSMENSVVIKLADGTTKIVNSRGNKIIKDASGNVIANQGDNSLVFDSDGEQEEIELKYNEIYIPYGQTFKLELSDGTLVWLNAGSKLRFPQKFKKSNRERVVYLVGEGFFDVSHNKDQPFIVNTQEVDVKVLGTKFNISSYETDKSIVTTLVEGAVNVYETRTPGNVLKLTPDFQADYNKFGNNFTKAKVDTKIYTSWIDNLLIIEDLRFEEILIKLERKYGVKFENKVADLNDNTYKGEFKNEDLESILKTIALSTPFKYEINNNTITINK